MRKLINGLIDFQHNVRPTYRETFHRLATTQHPDCLFIACSDSRVVPNLFASSNPGDLFVVRNVGNLMPPCACNGLSSGDRSYAAALEFAIEELKVPDVVVCGHSECGAMKALASEKATGHRNLDGWLDYARPSLKRLTDGDPGFLNPQLSRHDRLSQLNVLQQLEHLGTYPMVRDRVASGELRLHGWWFEIPQAVVHAWSPERERFVVLDEAEGRRLLSRIGEADGDDGDVGADDAREPSPA